MKTWRLLSSLAVVAVLILSARPASPAGDACGTENWGYRPPIGPDRWAQLSPRNAQCAAGREQSPIHVVNPRPADLPPLEISYGIVPLRVLNKGYTIEAYIQPTPGSRPTLTIQGVTYELERFHFHTRSEHKVNGKDWPIEMHLVHQGPGGRVAVIGVMIEAGAPNAEMTKLWQKIPRQTCRTAQVTHFDLAALLPNSHASYRYAGSLTTPACGQGVAWNVLAEPITITDTEIRAFQSLYPRSLFVDGNRRPVQALNGRVVVTDVR